MKSTNIYINEALKLGKSRYKYCPKTKKELQELLRQLIEKRGNDGDFNDIDTSKITDMSELFKNFDKFNCNISSWDVSNVTDMSYMFAWCESFNQDLSSWDISKVRSKTDIFNYCSIEDEYKPKFK